MKRQFIYYLLFSMLAIAFACENNTETTPSGAYLYKSYDSTGTAIVEGWFTMNQQDSEQIIGEWQFEKIGNPQDIGPQVGSGELVGGVGQNRIWVELNPQFRDNNLQLSGTIVGDKFNGTWQWLSFAGVTNHGTFEAVKN